jgi:DNA polymerase-3 subunit alpha
VVFAKSYNRFADILEEDAAVIIQGNIAVEEGEAPRVLLSSAAVLIADSEYLSATEKVAEPTLYIKIPSLSDLRINNIKRIAALNRGNAKIVLFDESRRKYCAMKDLSVDPSDSVLAKLSSLFGSENVILK